MQVNKPAELAMLHNACSKRLQSHSENSQMKSVWDELKLLGFLDCEAHCKLS